MKLNWFSPLPPLRSGIAADFFRSVFPTLTEQAEVTLWTDQTHWASWIEPRAHVRKFSLDNMPWVELNRADLSFFNLGNDYNFHGSIWEVSRLLPGVTILHDLHLKEFFDNWRRVRPITMGGDSSLAVSRENRPSSLAATIEEPATDIVLALENSLGVVVHTKEAYDELNAANRWIVAHIPLAFALPRTSQLKPPKEILESPYRLIVFGFLNRNRRLSVLLQALATFPDKERFVLEIYGELWDTGFVKQEVKKLGLHDNVHIKGFLPEEMLDEALATADLAVNLRYPSLGEASGSQLRIWSHALPSIVTRAGWFATLPDNTVAHVDPECEIADIQKHLGAFLAHPDVFMRMGLEGKRLLNSAHAPETYMQSLLKLAEQVIDFRPRAAAHYLARRTGEGMSPWIDAVISDDPLRRVAEEILTLT